MGATVLEEQHPPHAEALVAIEPTIDRIRIARLEEAVPRDSMGRLPVRDLQEGRTPLPDIGPPIMVAVLEQFLALGLRQG
jgi:hypothetical protein